MLERGRDLDRLEPPAEGRGHLAREDGVLAEVLVVPRARRRARDVAAGPQKAARDLAGLLVHDRARLRAHGAAHGLGELAVEGGGVGDAGREVGDGLVAPDAVRAVVHPEVGQPEARNVARARRAGLVEDLHLLKRRHVPEDVLDALLDRRLGIAEERIGGRRLEGREVLRLLVVVDAEVVLARLVALVHGLGLVDAEALQVRREPGFAVGEVPEALEGGVGERVFDEVPAELEGEVFGVAIRLLAEFAEEVLGHDARVEAREVLRLVARIESDLNVAQEIGVRRLVEGEIDDRPRDILVIAVEEAGALGFEPFEERGCKLGAVRVAAQGVRAVPEEPLRLVGEGLLRRGDRLVLRHGEKPVPDLLEERAHLFGCPQVRRLHEQFRGVPVADHRRPFVAELQRFPPLGRGRGELRLDRLDSRACGVIEVCAGEDERAVEAFDLLSPLGGKVGPPRIDLVNALEERGIRIDRALARVREEGLDGVRVIRRELLLGDRLGLC